METKPLKQKRIAMIIAKEDFRDEELFIPRSIFLQQGAEVKIVSEKKGKAIGSYGGVIDIDMDFDEFDVSKFDAIVFVGGAGASKYIEDDTCHQIAKKAQNLNKIIAAICIAPVILAKSGILKGKKATVWSSHFDKKPPKILKQEGVQYQPENVVVDGNIVTANGPQSARKFAQSIVELLKEI